MIFTVAPFWKPLPVMVSVTVVPTPAIGGETFCTVRVIPGAGVDAVTGIVGVTIGTDEMVTWPTFAWYVFSIISRVVLLVVLSIRCSHEPAAFL